MNLALQTNAASGFQKCQLCTHSANRRPGCAHPNPELPACVASSAPSAHATSPPSRSRASSAWSTGADSWRGRASRRRPAPRRSTSRVAELQAQADQDGISSGTGIAHTRATHGVPAVHNAHPHFSATAPCCCGSRRPHRLVHNGIIENHDELRAELKSAATTSPARRTPRSSPTWWTTPTRATCSRPCRPSRCPAWKGAYAVAVFCRDEAASRGGCARRLALVLGVGEGELRRLRRHGPGGRDGPDRLPGRRRRRRPAAGSLLALAISMPPAAASGRRARGQDRSRPQRPPPSWAPTATTCRRKSSSSPRPSPTRSKPSPASAPSFWRRRLPPLQGDRQGPDPGLRHQLLQRLDRQVLAGEHRQDPHQRRDRQRVPLPRQRARPQDSGRHHQPER